MKMLRIAGVAGTVALVAFECWSFSLTQQQCVAFLATELTYPKPDRRGFGGQGLSPNERVWGRSSPKAVGSVPSTATKEVQEIGGYDPGDRKHRIASSIPLALFSVS